MAPVAGGAGVVSLVRDHEIDMPSTVAQVRDAMQGAIASRAPLRICGASTWSSGPMLEYTRTLSLRALSGIIAYVPGDLTLTAWAGTTLTELSHATAAQGQWLGLDPAGDGRGTLGATIATASSGPLAHAFGTPRDLVLGLEAITGYGDKVTPGGRVVKNVAGFDLVRLYTGAWGTLGPIVSATVRLRALPVHEVTLAMNAGDSSGLAALMERLRSPTIAAIACEWIDARTAESMSVGSGHDVVLVRIGGNDAFIRGQCALLESTTDCTRVEAGVWGALRTLDAGGAAVIRISGPVSALPDRIATLRSQFRDVGVDVAMHASVGRGVVRVITRGDVGAARQVLQTIALSGDRRMVERLPDDWWPSETDPFLDGLAGRIRNAFDPHLLCNRRRGNHDA